VAGGSAPLELALPETPGAVPTKAVSIAVLLFVSFFTWSLSSFSADAVLLSEPLFTWSFAPFSVAAVAVLLFETFLPRPFSPFPVSSITAACAIPIRVAVIPIL
jgi:hypothetical protein